MRHAYSQLEVRWESVAEEQHLSVADQRVREICFGNEDIRALIAQVDRSLAFFRDMGVICRGIKQGLFDFPCLLQDRFVFLCWQAEEERIAFWHELDTDYEGRRPLLEATELDSQAGVYVN